MKTKWGTCNHGTARIWLNLELAKKPDAEFGDYVRLTKPRVISLLLVTTAGAMFVAAGGVPDGWLLLWTMVGGYLAAGGANAINMYVDRDIDALMKRTEKRPLVTGAVSPREALIFAIGLEIAATQIAVEGLAQAVDHGRIGLQPHAQLQASHEHPGDARSLLRRAGFLLDDRGHGQRLERGGVRKPLPAGVPLLRQHLIHRVGGARQESAHLVKVGEPLALDELAQARCGQT